MQYVMSFSGGLCSWFAARCLINRHGTRAVTLLFADTNFEHADLYRFLVDASVDLGVPITRIADGRTPWDVFFENRMMGNSRIDLCSRILKRELLDKWSHEYCDPLRTVQCVGLSHAEKSRYIRFRSRMRARGWKTQAPAMAFPQADKNFMMEALRARGLELSESYEDGFAHDNCGGFCVKQGMAGFRLLLTKRREFYLFNEAQEEKFRQMTGKNVSIMRDRSGGTVKPLTLKVFRERIESGQICAVGTDQGGCGCAIDG